MGKGRLETGKAPQIFVGACDGDLVIRGGAEPALLVRGEYTAEEKAGGYHLTGRGDLRLVVPSGATVSVEEVSGKLIVKGVAGACEVGRVYGDAVLSMDGPTRIEAVHGDLSARNVDALAVGEVHGDTDARRAGGLAISAVYGDLVARQIAGPVTVEEVSGNVDVRSADGNVAISRAHHNANVFYAKGQVTLRRVDGDVCLRGALSPGNHAVAARGDIIVRWPANAPLNLVAAGRQIDNRLPLQDIVEKDGRLTARLGSDGANLTLSADGRVSLKEGDPDEKWEFGPEGEEYQFEAVMEGFDMENIAAKIEAEVNNHLARVARDFETHLGPEFGQRMAEKAARQAERAAERVERSRRKSDWRGRAAASAAAAEAAPTPSRRTASPEEQLKILKMVESGAITPEDAGMLLEALEG
jgi:DUF4097 and DUF4098 domain-containing protein YvlB